ncbi:unnamed protein product [Vitrella brassicaformis CCMP3155]|uniref:Uncharacterized protein n=1 Tax=Vitrella brassicaformis (strain CCMP3155) TaxID=1169540 RepID=A0A0G4EIY1_VITBC|nr:unnamed protein product [Vitrella brassicaformis CCMP3155]|eukprot:CEL95954.1 unnamed protein product [Vitrella brassicaformis CCMP3155]
MSSCPFPYPSMAAAASSSSAAAAAAHVADLPHPPATSSSDRDRPTASPPPLSSTVISKAAHSEPTRRALLSKITDTNQHVVLQCVKEEIDRLMADKGLKNVITLSADLTSLNLLLDLVYIIQQSGEWAETVPIIRVAKHQGRGGGQLPIELGSADVERVGSRAVCEGRCEALRQLSLIQRHIGIPLERDSNGLERLGGRRLTIRPLLTLPANHPFRNGYDEANPVCEYHGAHFLSVRDAVLCRMGFGGSKVVDQCVTLYNDTARYNRLRQLARQPPPIWGCHTISTIHWATLQAFDRIIVLHGDQPDHTFTAHIYIQSFTPNAEARLFTTERPVDGKEGAALLPQTVRVVHEMMRDAAVVAFGNRLAIALPPAAGDDGSGQGGEQTSGPAVGAAAAASSSAAAAPPAAGAAAGSLSQHNGGDLMGIDSGGGPASSADGQGGGAGGGGSCGGSSRDLLQKIRSMRSVASQLVSDLDVAERMIASQADSTLDGASLAGSLSTILAEMTKQLAEIADHNSQVPISVPLVSDYVSSSSAAPAAAASAPAAGGAGGDGNRGEKGEAAASSASTGDDGGEGEMAADDRRRQRRRGEQTAKAADGGSMMGDE